jgi:hypothetical protein
MPVGNPGKNGTAGTDESATYCHQTPSDRSNPTLTARKSLYSSSSKERNLSFLAPRVRAENTPGYSLIRFVPEVLEQQKVFRYSCPVNGEMCYMCY